MQDFIDYTIIGLNKFQSNKFTYWEFLITGNYGIGLLSILLIVLLFFNLYKIIKLKDYKLTTIYIYSLSTLSIMYPISNEYHILMAFCPSAILSFWLLFHYLTEINEKAMNKFSKTIYFGIVILILILIFYICRALEYTKYKHYRYVYIEKKLRKI